MASSAISRRRFLARSVAVGCSAAASPFLTPVTLAAAPWDQRLVVIILRGAMDGLDVVQPYGDPEFASTRKRLRFGEAGGATDLDGFFSLHPGLSPLTGLWLKGELGFAHAVSTPYRDKRSHFDGQDLLEAGTGFDFGNTQIRDGWLNRMLQAVPGLSAQTAYAIGQDELLILSGDAEVSSWSPDARLSLSPQAKKLLAKVSHNDPLFREALNEAVDIAESTQANAGVFDPETDNSAAEMQSQMMAVARGENHLKVVNFAINRLLEETRIASFSINGWDTHNNQSNGLKKPLSQLSDTILALKQGLGSVWGQTTVLAMTEFGRTVRENGSGGTDHGTGGAMIMAGGALRGGQVWGNWPGLALADLYKGRDLTPTEDVRAYAASAMQGLFGLDRHVLETAVFPGLDMGGVGRIIL
ncbi:DUF1501 domain-containing protein [Actibacterium lipolyticum]|uniref:Twin-arginine translocation pathway signal n=1 Tax=Actibacterium lipolyticum TaxID=1524263 RepID=A0A238JM89_9RHOB|nr:DUF1501 domain-containing protein [Actibacterium lipolyticum]SMX31798.1 hypothetical protein COL8621_00609 [Actibacterium lipolyticum]